MLKTPRGGHLEQHDDAAARTLEYPAFNRKLFFAGGGPSFGGRRGQAHCYNAALESGDDWFMVRKDSELPCSTRKRRGNGRAVKARLADARDGEMENCTHST